MGQVQITFRNMNSHESLERLIRDKAEKLYNRFEGMSGCHVTIERPHRSQQHGNIFDVHIEAQIPGKNIVVTRLHHEDDRHAEPDTAVRDAFSIAERQLDEAKDRLRRNVKAHTKG
jgi:ribosome-associated translation inhibitor RaiA